MFVPSLILLTAGALMLLSVFASKVSDRYGVPALIFFLGIGMLAGSDGPGGIQFDNTWAANMVGTVALAFILFSGGLDTDWRAMRPVLGRGAVLSSLGVVATAALVGLFSWAVLGFPLPVGMLLGAIISSTDAAAVFSILRGRGVALKGNLRPLLELESGSNDPMAVFLTLGMTRILAEPGIEWTHLATAFLMNMSLGAAVGLVIGAGAGWLFNRIRLENAGLYPVFGMSLVLLTFGASEQVGGNGFLAVYLCGIMMNRSDFAYKRTVAKFHDGVAWLMQILMFLVLGLLVYPSHLPGVAFKALLFSLFLMAVARPAAVALGLWGSAFSLRERAMVAWTGLRGAVPIVLATFPLMAGFEGSAMVFNMVFFTVLTSVLVQGTLLMPVARWLGVDEPLSPRPVYSLEIERSGQMQGETREIEILPNMAVVGKAIADLDIPDDVIILLIGRGSDFLVPRGQTRLRPHDTLLLLGKGPTVRGAIETILSPAPVARVVNLPVDPLATLPLSTEEKYISKQVVVVGYGRVGRRVCDALAARGIPFVVAEQTRELVEELRGRGIPAVSGDASTAMALAQAHVARAAALVITVQDAMKARQMVDIAMALNPDITIMARAASGMEVTLLAQGQKGKIFIAEHELADGMARSVLQCMRAGVSDGENSAQKG